MGTDSDTGSGDRTSARRLGGRPKLVAVSVVLAIVVGGGLVWSACSDSSSRSGVRTDDLSPPGGANVTSSTASPTTTVRTTATTPTTPVRTTATSSTTIGSSTTVPPTATETTTVPSTTALPSTEVIEYSPYGADGVLAVPAEETERGTCWAGALATSSDRTDAYRCITEASQVLDPCFSPPDSSPSQVACPSGSGAPELGVMILELTESLPELDPAATDVLRPFYLVLDDGTACTPFTGTRVSVEGIWMDYGCGSPETGLLLLGGALDTSSAEWTLSTTNADRTEPLTTSAIATAYV